MGFQSTGNYNNYWGEVIDNDMVQILAQAEVMASVLGVCIAVSAYFNGKHIKDGISKVMEKMDEGFRKMDERTAKISEQIGKIPSETAKIIGR